MYIKGEVCGKPITFTMHTGAPKTVIASRVYNSLDVREKPELVKAHYLVRAGGTPLQDCGVAEFTIMLGPLEILVEAAVADVEDDALLGYDVLRGSEHGAADILLSENKIVLGGVEVPCFQVGGEGLARCATVAGDCREPSQQEASSEGYVRRTQRDDFGAVTECYVDVDSFSEQNLQELAFGRVDSNHSHTCTVETLNHNSEVPIYRQEATMAEPANATYGTCHTVECNACEKENCSREHSSTDSQLTTNEVFSCFLGSEHLKEPYQQMDTSQNVNSSSHLDGSRSRAADEGTRAGYWRSGQAGRKPSDVSTCRAGAVRRLRPKRPRLIYMIPWKCMNYMVSAEVFRSV